MKKSKILLVLLVLLFVMIYPYVVNAQTVSVIYSSFNNGVYNYKDIYKNSFNQAGLTCEEYENTTLDNFNFNVDCILLSTVANYENTKDLSKYPFRKFVEDGGVLIITDANYPSVLDFLPQSFGLVFKAGASGSQGKTLNAESEKAIPYPVHHPLLKGVRTPRINWGIVTELSPEFKPLYVDLEGRPVVVYTEIGKGLLVVSTLQKDNSFPKADFVKNAIEYAKSYSNSQKKKNDIYYITELNKGVEKEFKLVPVFGPNKDNTDCVLKYDDDFLTFSVNCYDSDLINRTTNAVNRDDDVNSDDSVEIYIYNENELYGFSVNSNNVKFDSKNGHKNYNTYFESSVDSKGNMWNATVKIPYSSIGMTKDSRQAFKLNVFRNYHTGKSEETLYSLVSVPYNQLTNIQNWENISFATKLDLKDLREDLSLDAKEAYNYGENKIKLSDKLTFNIINVTTNETFKGKGGICQVNFTEVGENQIMGVAYVGERCVGSTPIYNVNVNDVLSYDIIYPKYRDQVMSKDPNKNLRINLMASEKLSVDFSLKGERKNVFSKKYTLLPNKPTLITYNLEKLSVGDYKYTLKVSKGGKALRTIEKDFKVLPPNDVEITFDEKQVCYENGKPIFPIMLYHTAGGMLSLLNKMKKAETPEVSEAKVIEELKERGFTLGHAIMNDFGIVDRYAHQGLNIVSEIGDCRDRDRLQQFIDAYNKNKNGIFYYTIDEPVDEKLEHDIEMYNILKEMDPYRPCGGAVCFAPVFKEAVNCFDVMMPDAYEITKSNPNPSFGGLFRLMEPANEYGKKSGKALWAVPQSFGWVNFGNWIMPTCEQMKCQAFFYIAYGATGLCWYAFGSGEPDKDTPYGAYCIYDYPEQWNYFKTLNREVTEFAQVIFKGESVGPLGVNDKIHTNVWKIGDKSYALLVNAEPTPQSETYEMKGNIKSYFDEYTYDFSQAGDKVTFNLKPYECAIVEY